MLGSDCYALFKCIKAQNNSHWQTRGFYVILHRQLYIMPICVDTWQWIAVLDFGTVRKLAFQYEINSALNSRYEIKLIWHECRIVSDDTVQIRNFDITIMHCNFCQYDMQMFIFKLLKMWNLFDVKLIITLKIVDF